jgi:hypothetical protein
MVRAGSIPPIIRTSLAEEGVFDTPAESGLEGARGGGETGISISRDIGVARGVHGYA